MQNFINSYNTAGLQCPSTSDNRMLVRFIEAQRLGVTLGPRTMGCLCLQGFFEVVDKFLTTTIVIPSEQTVKVELGNVANYGYRRETWTFNISDFLTDGDTVNAILGTSSDSESFSFATSTTFNTFIYNMRAAINASTYLKSTFEIVDEDKITKTFNVRTIKNGLPLTCNFTVNTVPIPGEQLFNSIRYPRGRCSFMFLLADYNEFTEPIPASNLKHLQYAFDDNYSDNQLTTENIIWRRLGKMYANSSDVDLNETDMNLVETIWVKNTLTYDVTMQVLFAS